MGYLWKPLLVFALLVALVFLTLHFGAQMPGDQLAGALAFAAPSVA